MLKPLVIIGAGGFARETLDVIDAINEVEPQFDCLGFVVDTRYGQVDELINNKPILGDFSWFTDHQNVLVICGIGAPEVRRRMTLRIEEMKLQFATLIHPNTVITRWVDLGIGVVITAGCVFTNRIRVGNHVHINLGCTIGHDSVFEDYVTLAPGVHVSGNVYLKEGCYVGTGANIIQKKNMGEWAVVGAGSTVVKDVPANSTVVGVPGSVIKERPAGWHLYEV